MSATTSPIAEFEREIEEIRSMGGDLTREHHVGHSLRFAERQDAERAAQRLEADGVFEASVMDESFDGSWNLYASQEQVLNARNIEQTCLAMERLAAEFGGEYEDWQVGVHMDSWPDCECTWPKDQSSSL